MRKEKILWMISSLDYGGTETYVCSVLPLLKEHFDVAVCVTCLPRQAGEWNPLASRLIGAGIPVHQTRLYGQVELRDEYDWVEVMRLATWLRTQSPPFAVVHTLSRPLHIAGRLAALLAGNTRIVIDYRSIFSRKFTKKRYLKWERRLFPYTDRILFVSEDSYNDYCEYWETRHPKLCLPAGRMRVITNGIDLSNFYRRGKEVTEPYYGELGIARGAFIVGMIGRFHPKKRFDIFLGAAKTVLSKGANAYFLIIGGGEETELKKYKELAQRLGIAERVRFLGKREDIAELLSFMDASVLASEYEGVPRVVLESLACGTPIVASDVPGMGGVISDGREGFLVRSNRAEEFAEALLRLHHSPDMRARMSKAAIARAKHYDVRRSAEELAELYRELLAEKNFWRGARRNIFASYLRLRRTL
jgi:glycosyltransferase involved in cell wall biosynthesis